MVYQDGQTISAFLLNTSYKEIVSMLILPYAGLYCKEAGEFYGKMFVEPEVDAQIIDLRNAIKIFCSKYNIFEKEFLQLDHEQDDFFKNQLRFDFTKQMNIHYNMGMYFDKNGHLFGNTQLIMFHLQSVSMSDPNMNIKIYNLGCLIGVSVRRILMLANKKPQKVMIKHNPEFCVGYIDCNSSSDNAPFVSTGDKGLNLLMLHLLSSFGTCKYVLRVILNNNNQWLYRCEYIIYHNIWTGLKKIKSHFEQKREVEINIEKLSELVESGRRLFPSSYRNCMMHYNLIHDGEPYIKEGYYKPDIPLYGLVESCFEGKSAIEYYDELRSYMDKVEEYLNTWFSFDYSKISWDL